MHLGICICTPRSQFQAMAKLRKLSYSGENQVILSAQQHVVSQFFVDDVHGPGKHSGDNERLGKIQMNVVGSVAGSLASAPQGADSGGSVRWQRQVLSSKVTDQVVPIQKSKNVEMVSLSWKCYHYHYHYHGEKYALLLESYRRNYIENRTSGSEWDTRES